MKSILVFLLLMLNAKVSAVEFTSTVHSIDPGKSSQPYLVRFDNGRVIFVRSMDKDLISAFAHTSRDKRAVKVRTNKDNFLHSVQAIGDYQDEISPQEWATKSDPFKPTVVKNTNSALIIFNKMRKDFTKEGECYNRAHVWSYEEHKRSGVNTMKVFMFFTERYIRKYKFHWWFHVTPAIYVASLKSLRTLDRRYTSGPRLTKTWSDVFVKSKRTCKRVAKFDDYWLNQTTQDCYHIVASMYYVIPRDLEKRDLTGIEKSGFSEKELQRAYRNGFKI